MTEIIEKRAVPGTTRRARSEERRRRILEAARACFGRNGYAGATVEAIAAEAGVSNGLLYQFFRNKDHLLLVVLEDLIRDWVRAMVPRDAAQRVMDELWEIGARGILVTDIHACRL